MTSVYDEESFSWKLVIGRMVRQNIIMGIYAYLDEAKDKEEALAFAQELIDSERASLWLRTDPQRRMIAP